jgi:hypothetical protein
VNLDWIASDQRFEYKIIEDKLTSQSFDKQNKMWKIFHQIEETPGYTQIFFELKIQESMQKWMIKFKTPSL